MYGTANRELEDVKNHLDNLLLSLNVNKCAYIHFSASRAAVPPHLQLIIHTCQNRGSCVCLTLEIPEKIKYLGIYLDPLLRWDEHTCYLNKKLRKTIYLFKELSHLLPRSSLLQAYYSLCQSQLLYGNLGWGGSTKTQLDKLNKTQKLILRIIHHKPPRYSSSLLYAESGVLDVRKLYVKTSLTHFRQHPEQFERRNYEYNTRMRSYLLPPRMHRSFGQRHYIFLAPKFFNLLPDNVKSTFPLTKFKKSVHEWIREMTNEDVERLFAVQN